MTRVPFSRSLSERGTSETKRPGLDVAVRLEAFRLGRWRSLAQRPEPFSRSLSERGTSETKRFGPADHVGAAPVVSLRSLNDRDRGEG